jgi:hypothetical protein
VVAKPVSVVAAAAAARGVEKAQHEDNARRLPSLQVVGA